METVCAASLGTVDASHLATCWLFHNLIVNNEPQYLTRWWNFSTWNLVLFRHISLQLIRNWVDPAIPYDFPEWLLKMFSKKKCTTKGE
jgi:hypothetical protein